jgi:outer membrane protein OmpA-like peptidoglycan-associated protein/Mg-chelatase subunit ChlD
MKRISYGLIFLLMFFILITGCATFRPVDLNPQIKSGQLVQKTDNFIVLFDRSASMNTLHGTPMVNEATRLIHAKDAAKNMIATIPEIKLNAGLRTFWSEETALLYGMKSLVKEDYTKAINSIENVYGRTPMGKAITAAGNDLKSAGGNSAMIIVSDFSEIPGIDDIRPATVMEAITKVNAEYGDKLCVYAIQVGYTADGKELSEQIVQNVEGGYTVNADKLVTPAAMAAFVEKVISGNCSRYPQLVAKPTEKVVILAAEPKVEEKVVAAVSETKAEEKVVTAVSEPKAEEKVVILILAFEDVHFDFDKSTLKPEAQTILKRNIQILKDNPKAKVRIAGYTSASGTDAYNQKLSERRANAVHEYLISEGVITRDRLSTIGYGETNPAMYEAAPKEIYSKEAKANMRVLFEIIVQ